MTSFLHKLAEGLRAREQYLEDHTDHPVFEADRGEDFKDAYDDLLAEVKEFSRRVRDLAEAGEDYDEHFERKISDEHHKLSVKIDSWVKSIKDR